jgi:23S rRNA-intervening sequence protein
MAEKRSVLDIPLFHKVYDFYKLLHSYHEKIPKTQRYTLWQRCENISLSLLEQLISTSHLQGMERVQILHAISHNVDLLKVLIRLAQETSTITPRQYLALQTHLQEIGKMVGGWLKSVAH